MQTTEPPAVIQAIAVEAPAEFVVVSKDSRADLIVGSDTPLPLFKAGRTEDALLRQGLFVTTTLAVVRATAPPHAQALRWTYEPFLQHQLCFRSMTGQFSCTVAEVMSLPDKYAGEAPFEPAPADSTGPPTNPAAEAARAAVAESLRARSTALFGDTRRLKIEPMLTAAGVSVRGSAGR